MKEWNAALNAKLQKILCLISPFFLLKASHKFLEYLLRQYHIHLYNVDALFECALPFHETNIFARIVQLAKIE